METTKTCGCCKITKSILEFNKNKSKKDGLSFNCKSCIKIYKDENRKNNPEKIKLSRQKHYEKNRENLLKKSQEWKDKNREHHNKTSRQYRDKNREIIIKKKKEYYLKNKENHLQVCKEWAFENKEKLKEYKSEYYLKNKEMLILKSNEYRKTEQGKIVKRNSNHKRRTLTKNGDVTTQQLKELYSTVKNCYWCNTKLNKNNTHLDHFMPLSKGGLHTIDNLVLSCSYCNLQKHAKDPYQFANEKGRLL